MGIISEYNPDLALRKYSQFEKGKRKKEECIPNDLIEGKEYHFLKKDQRIYWLHGEIPLLETKGSQNLSEPLASVVIKSATHFLSGGEVWTKGVYEVVEVFNYKDIHFNGFAKINNTKK